MKKLTSVAILLALASLLSVCSFSKNGLGISRKLAIARLENMDYKFEYKTTFDGKEEYAKGDWQGKDKTRLRYSVSLHGPAGDINRISFLGTMPGLVLSSGSAYVQKMEEEIAWEKVAILGMHLYSMMRLANLMTESEKDGELKDIHAVQNLILECLGKPDKQLEHRANGRLMKLSIDRFGTSLSAELTPEQRSHL